MDYLTDHSGKLIDNTGAVSHMYNLLKEEVGIRNSNKSNEGSTFTRITRFNARLFPGRAKSDAAKMDGERLSELDARNIRVGLQTSIIHEDFEKIKRRLAQLPHNPYFLSYYLKAKPRNF